MSHVFFKESCITYFFVIYIHLIYVITSKEKKMKKGIKGKKK